MKLFLLGKSASITHWLEDASSGFRAAGHEVALGFTRRPWLSAAVERAMEGSFTASIVRRIRQFDPELILVIGGLHIPQGMLEAVAAIPGRPPLIGWVGDLFDGDARAVADGYDTVNYTDSGLEALHHTLGFTAPTRFLPHAVNPDRADQIPNAADRRARMVFVANPTPHRRTVVAALTSPVALYGPTWKATRGVDHDVHAARVAHGRLRGVYLGHTMALNIRNERHVLRGLNQRNFEPCLAGAALITDAQADLERCFEPGVEVLAWRDVDELNATHERLLRAPSEAAAIGERGRRRVLAEHTYERRLETLMERGLPARKKKRAGSPRSEDSSPASR